jgi:hypothetical protein
MYAALTPGDDCGDAVKQFACLTHAPCPPEVLDISCQSSAAVTLTAPLVTLSLRHLSLPLWCRLVVVDFMLRSHQGILSMASKCSEQLQGGEAYDMFAGALKNIHQEQFHCH